MARVLVATQAWGVLMARAPDGALSALGNKPVTIDTTVYAAASGDTVVQPANFKTNGDGELPGYVEQGSHVLTVDDEVLAIEAVVGETGGVPISTKTASYTLTLADANTIIEMDSVSAQVFTIPPDGSVAFPVGTTIEFMRIGAGSVTLTPGTGVTIPNSIDGTGVASRTITAQNTSASAYKRSANVWRLTGAIA